MRSDRPSLADSIRGDLAEERARRLRTQSQVRVACWHARAALAIALYFAARRAADVFRGRPGRFDRIGGEGRQALRALVRSPWYAATVVSVVGLTFALATTVFALVDGVLFRALPYRAPAELVRITGGFSELPSFTSMSNVSVPDVLAWKSIVPGRLVTAFSVGDVVTIAELETLRSAEVDADFFDVIGVRPLVGGFVGADFTAGSIRPALLAYGIWQSRFAGDPAVVGRTFSDSRGAGIRVAGILPREFVFPFEHGQILPVVLTPLTALNDARRNAADDRWLNVIARVPRGTPLAPLRERLRASAGQVARIFPPLPPPPSEMSAMRRITRGPFDDVRLTPLNDLLVESSRPLSAAVFATTIALVTLAMLNLASLAAGRALDRRRELTLRRALGGTTLAIARPLLAETAIVVGLGTLLGIAAAHWLLSVALALLPSTILLLKAPAIDWRVAMFAVLSAVVVTGVTAWAVRTATRQPATGSAAAAGGTTETSRSWSRAGIVAAEVALALLMMVGATLVASSLIHVWQQPSGFRTDNNASLFVALPRERSADYLPRLFADLSKVPGVRHVGGLGLPFLQNMRNGCSFQSPTGLPDDVECLWATGGTMRALDVRVIEGRLPSEADFDTRRLVVVSARTAREFWPASSSIGRVVMREGQAFEVAAVIEEVRFNALDLEPRGSIFASIYHLPRPGLQTLIVSFDGDPVGGLEAVRAALATNHRELRVRSAQTVIDALSASVSVRQRTFQTWLFSAFGIAALVVAGVGVLGSLAMATARRTREVGVRLALGATRGGVVWMILRENFRPVAAGMVAGTTVGVWAVRFVSTLLYKLTPYDWTAWSVAIATILVVAIAASIVPAWRAGRVDPVTALRMEG